MNRALFISDYQQLSRLHPAEDLPRVLADYVKAMPLMPQHWSGRKINPDKIIGLCCQHFEMSLDKMRAFDRSEKIRYPRQVTMYLMVKRAGMIHNKIADLFDRDRTTVIASRDRIQDLIDSDPDIRDEIWQLNAQL